MDNRYFIVGIKHCGKSTIGRRLAKELNTLFIDLDTEIESSTGMKVRDFYKKFGKDKFQEKEFEELLKLSKESFNYICATGGGICDNERAFKLLKEMKNTIYINTDFQTVYKRIIANGVPAFLTSENPEDEFRELYTKRNILYKELAQYEVNGSNKSPFEITENIIKRIKE